MTAEQNAAANENFTNQAELVVEVVSADDPDRDYVVKGEEYALAAVPEYWIVDRFQGHIAVLRFWRVSIHAPVRARPPGPLTEIRLEWFQSTRP